MQHYVEIVERKVNDDDQNIRDAVKDNINGKRSPVGSMASYRAIITIKPRAF